MKWTGNKPSHKGAKVSMRRNPVEPNVGDHTDVSSHKDLIRQGLGISIHKEEDNRD